MNDTAAQKRHMGIGGETMTTGQLRVVLSGKAKPATVFEHTGTVFAREGKTIPASELPETARVMFNVNYTDPTGGSDRTPYNMVAVDAETGDAWYVYCRAGHFNIPKGGLPIA